MSNIQEKKLIVNMKDGTKWSIPAITIAKHRSSYYANESGRYDGTMEEHLKDKTIPLFESDDFEIEDWAKNNMNWCDLESTAKLIAPSNVDYDEMWLDSDVDIV